MSSSTGAEATSTGLDEHVPIPEAKGWLGVGLTQTCMLAEDGSVYCSHFAGEPERVRPLPNAVAVVVGIAHACALGADATAYCWGVGGSGQLGYGGRVTQTDAQPVSDLAGRVTDLAAGGWHTCAVDLEGTAWCWGDNRFAQLGDSMEIGELRPTRVTTAGTGIRSIAAGLECTCVDGGGPLRCWGEEERCSLFGDSAFLEASINYWSQTREDEVPVTHAFGGHMHFCRARDSGDVECWGENREGQLGRASPDFSLDPLTVEGLGPMVVAGGVYARSCAMDAARRLYCWGDDWSNGNAGPTPVEIPWPADGP